MSDKSRLLDRGWLHHHLPVPGCKVKYSEECRSRQGIQVIIDPGKEIGITLCYSIQSVVVHTEVQVPVLLSNQYDRACPGTGGGTNNILAQHPVNQLIYTWSHQTQNPPQILPNRGTIPCLYLMLHGTSHP